MLRLYIECASNPCENNGTCSDLIGHFTCDCMPGYTGHGETGAINFIECNPNHFSIHYWLY